MPLKEKARGAIARVKALLRRPGGVLGVTLEVGRLRFVGNLPKVFKGTHVDEEEVRVFRASQLELSASRPFPVYADGEHLTDLPASLRVLPRALSILAPPAAAA